ncbi:MAG TPA: hypothetical protein VK574_13240 [Terracidiphilus sp.]|nr:hypothetical protein [Terracidiphilus sp.]
MRYHGRFAFSALLMCCLVAAGKDKKKIILPADILEARTVLVVIDPDAGMAMGTPNANRTAQEDVEKALMNWGRFSLATDVSSADLIISVRKGNGKIVEPTIGGVPNNNRPVIFDPTDSGGVIGGHRGTAPQAGDPTNAQPQDPHPQIEVGSAQDMFAVYRGKRDNALDAPAVWRYRTKDALSSPGVPAVDVFKKLIAEAEKQQAAKP